LTGFVVLKSKISIFKRVSLINGRRFYIVLRVAGVSLFFEMYRSKSGKNYISKKSLMRD
jgi:hypothetical protein